MEAEAKSGGPVARIGMVARWQPVHLGHVAVLRALCRNSGQALIGIGSSNRHNLRTPFTLLETMDMIRLVLRDTPNYSLISVPDLDDGSRWRLMIMGLFGALDGLVTENPYVAHLMRGDYPIVLPVSLVDPADTIAVDGRMVRREMARGDRWRRLVPPAVADYIMERKLDERFRREFGLQTLALDTVRGD